MTYHQSLLLIALLGPILSVLILALIAEDKEENNCCDHPCRCNK